MAQAANGNKLDMPAHTSHQIRRIFVASLSVTGVLVALGLQAGPAEAQQSRPPVPKQNGAAARAAAAAAARAGGQTATTPAQMPVPSPVPAPNQAAAAPTTAGQQGAVTGSVGSTGDNVKKIEERLRALHYYVGTVDTTYDEDTAQAVTAFQKVNNMDRTGSVTPDVWNKMTTGKDPAPLVPGGGERRVEVDVAHQVLFLYEGNKLAEIVAVSTGSEESYCENGSCGDAVTPRGDFSIYRQGSGWEYGPLGALYNPAYFKGGFAIHGSNSVPNYPASHGCVRVPMSAAEWFPDRAPIGTPVYARG